MNRTINKELWNLVDSGNIDEETFHKVKNLNDIEICKFLIFNQFRTIIYKEANNIVIKSLLTVSIVFIILFIFNTFNRINIENLIPLSIIFMIIFVVFIVNATNEMISESLKCLPSIIKKIDFLHQMIQEEVDLKCQRKM